MGWALSIVHELALVSSWCVFYLIRVIMNFIHYYIYFLLNILFWWLIVYDKSTDPIKITLTLTLDSSYKLEPRFLVPGISSVSQTCIILFFLFSSRAHVIYVSLTLYTCSTLYMAYIDTRCVLDFSRKWSCLLSVYILNIVGALLNLLFNLSSRSVSLIPCFFLIYLNTIKSVLLTGSHLWSL